MKIKLNRKHLPKRIAAIGGVSACLFAFIWLAMLWTPFCLYDRHLLHMGTMWVFRIFTFAVIGSLFWTLVQRIHEITQGDDNDTGKY